MFIFPLPVLSTPVKAALMPVCRQAVMSKPAVCQLTIQVLPPSVPVQSDSPHVCHVSCRNTKRKPVLPKPLRYNCNAVCTALLTVSYWLVSLKLWSLVHLGEPLPRIEFGFVEAPQSLNIFWESSYPCVNWNTGLSGSPTPLPPPPKGKFISLYAWKRKSC